MCSIYRSSDGAKANVYVYTNGDEVELLLNGKSLGRKANPINDAKLRNQIRWGEIDYQKGKLEAVAYKNGKVVARHALETSGKPAKIIAEPDNTEWKADGMDLQHVKLTVVDSKGRRVTNWEVDTITEVEPREPAPAPAEAQVVAATDETGDDEPSTDDRISQEEVLDKLTGQQRLPFDDL